MVREEDGNPALVPPPFTGAVRRGAPFLTLVLGIYGVMDETVELYDSMEEVNDAVSEKESSSCGVEVEGARRGRLAAPRGNIRSRVCTLVFSCGTALAGAPLPLGSPGSYR